MIIEKIIARCQADYIVARHTKHADAKLYRVLQDCLKICEVCMIDAEENKILNGMIADLVPLAGKNRIYVEAGSDIYQRVCRFIFYREENTANINRYAITLREAAQRQINSQQLATYLVHNGGISGLYLQRPLVANKVSTKCLRLTETIQHQKDARIIITLLRQSNNSYKVLSLMGGEIP